MMANQIANQLKTKLWLEYAQPNELVLSWMQGKLGPKQPLTLE